MFMRAPAGGTCDTKLCWALIRGGFKYKDKLFTPEGLQQLLLKSGPEAKSKIQVKGKGDLLPMPTLPLTLPLTVQLKSETGVCWEARYSTAKTNTSESFKAKAD